MTLDLENRGLIGKGAQGSVWLTYDRAQARFLALKIVRVSDAPARLDELRHVASGEANPWLLSWIDAGTGADAPESVRQAFPEGLEGEFLWILMPHVHGPSAAELALADAGFGWVEALALGAQVAQKLARRPEGQAHLDLKPENVLIDRRSGEVFLVDGHLGTRSGSPATAAPEQRDPSLIPGPPADLFALGRMLRRLAARDVGEESRADALPPLPEIPDDWPSERRRTVRAFADLCDLDLCRPDPQERPSAHDAAKQLLEQSAALSGPDPTAVLLASMSRTHLERLDEEAQELGKRAIAREGGPRAHPHRRIPIILASMLLALGATAWTLHPHRHALDLSEAAIARSTASEPVPEVHVQPKAARDCSLGEILAPHLVRFLCPGEKPRDGHRRISAKVFGPSGLTTLALAGTDQLVWKVASPPVGATVSLELAGPHLYEFLSPTARPDDPFTMWCNVDQAPSRCTGVLPIDGRTELAPSMPPEDYQQIQKSQPERLVASDFTARGPTQLAAGPLDLVHLTAKGPGALTWNDTEHPCDPPRIPLDPQYIAPRIPFDLPEGATLWACPKPGAKKPLSVHLEGYKPRR